MRPLLVVLVALGACAREDVAVPAVLTISAEEVALGGERLVLVKDALRFEYLNLPELEQALRQAAADPCADIRASAAPRFAIIKRVMFTCAAAGRSSIGFRQASGVVQSLVLSRPTMPMSERRRRIVLAPRRVSFGTVDGALPAGDDRAFARALIDVTAVALNELSIADQQQLVLAVEDDVSLGQVLEVVQALEARHFSVRVAPAV